MAHPNATLAGKHGTGAKAPKPKVGDHVRYEYSMYRRGVESIYSGFGDVLGVCTVIASPGLRVRVTQSTDNAIGAEVQVFAHRCAVWPVGTAWPQPMAPEPAVENPQPPRVAIEPEPAQLASEPAAQGSLF